MASDVIIEVTDDSFDQEVLQSGTPVMIDFWAEWCVPCKMLMPTVEKVAEQYKGRVKVGKVNMDENLDTAVRYGIQGIPTLLVFKDGEVVDRFGGGNLRLEQIAERLDRVLEGAGASAE